MKKALMLGVVLLAAAGATSASAAEFGFYTPSGGAYCDGVKYSGTAPATGFHVYDGTYCSYPNGYLGGFSGSIKAFGPGKWFSLAGSQASGDGLPSTFTLVYYINPSKLTWELAYESSDYEIAFEVINGGTLEKGKPFAVGGKKLHESASHAGLVKAGLIKAK